MSVAEKNFKIYLVLDLNQLSLVYILVPEKKLCYKGDETVSNTC